LSVLRPYPASKVVGKLMDEGTQGEQSGRFMRQL
jgi:hypothetical protein